MSSKKNNRKSVRMDQLILNKDELKGKGDLLNSDSALAKSIREDMVPLDKEFLVKVVLEYEPMGGDEMTLRPGDMVRVRYNSREEKDEWFYGTNLTTNEFGLFPISNCETDQEKQRKKNRRSANEDIMAYSKKINEIEERMREMERLNASKLQSEGGSGGSDDDKHAIEQLNLRMKKLEAQVEKIHKIEAREQELIK